ncbi:Zn-dependent protease [Rubrobacter radiotolerans]|uniref:Site-2 protease family protein n=1 Tax=Rubrobacter radiotolerans TaxID=42256 RepID=A0A023X0L5_RUBRA|nr:site-2 protease family protein [Rubrobacter radiotolerans]AHY45540.1 Zn-dependent protease [Rubrobacter radiotolerans]MDX5892953.1 site-2 protease family protein [Rubrobacter radiotolerans]SMC02805.1 Zn-dependent protease (includes SpoIVFB) [Rubrobacter radiotolerans DSM 5868]
MFLQLFEINPAAAVALIAGFVVGITIHEAAHAYSALKLGDDTAYRQGRVTLNPASHLDVLGSLMLLMAGFGWGRPTPVAVNRLKGGVFGPVAVAFAGPLSNLLIVFVCAGLYLLPPFQSGYLQVTLAAVAFVNALLFVFNLIPIPPLDGSKIIFPFFPRFLSPFVDFMNQYGPFILIALVVASLLLNVPILGVLLAPVYPLLFALGLGDALIAMYGG